MVRRLAVVVLTLLVVVASAEQGCTSVTDPERDVVRLRSFLSQLQKAVASDDRAALTALVQFPVQRGAGGDMLSEAQFSKVYEGIFSIRTKRTLASQRVENLFHDDRGTAIGGGEIWFKWLSGIDEFRITMFDVSKYVGVGVVSIEQTERVDKLFIQLQRKMEKDDREGLAALLAFPTRVNNGKQTKILKNSDDLLKSYDQVFSAKVKKAVLAQRVSDLFVNSDGIMVGAGELWFSPERVGGNYRLHITTIND